MNRAISSGRSATALRYVACYALFTVLLVLSLVTFFVWRTTALLLIGALLGSSYALSFAYGVAQFLIGAVLFFVVTLAEPFLRDGARRGQLVTRFTRVALRLVVAVVVGIAIQELVRAFA